MAQNYIYTMQNLKKVTPQGKTIVDGVSLSFFHGAKIGVLGLNGSGKSTVLRIMAGLDDEFMGEAKPAEGTRIGFLPQEPALDPTLTVREIVEEGVAETRALLQRFEEISMAFGEISDDDEMQKLLDEQAKVQDKIDAAGAWELDSRVEMAMEALRCPDGEASCEHLSGGEMRRVALCRLLLSAPDMLLLDEPTNHLDAESVAWLERFLSEYTGTVVAVTHDRYFLDNCAGWILELDRGRGIPWEGNYSSWLEQKQNRLATEEKQASTRRQALARELEWVRLSPKARQAKSKARIAAYEKLAADDGLAREQKGEIYIPVAQRLGNQVIEARDLSKGFGDRQLMEKLSFSLPPGGIVGVIGPNGAGKSTLFRMLVGLDQPDGGSLEMGDTVQLSYVDQSRDALDPSKNVWEEISGGSDRIMVGNREMASRAYVGQFNFKGSDQQKKVGQLSGGERNRVHLAKLVRSGGNLLLLDEPTNDLDVETLRSLEEALLDFAGCAVVISHDRWFLDRIATHILAFEGESHVEWFEGNYQQYEADRKRRLGAAADQPQRIKYRPLTR